MKDHLKAPGYRWSDGRRRPEILVDRDCGRALDDELRYLRAEPVGISRSTGTAACAMAEQTDNLGDPPCPARIRGSNRRQSVGECLSFTFLMRAPPAAQPKLHRYGLALDRQILKAAVGPAMPISGPPSAIRANAEGWSGSGNNPTIIICERDTQNFCPWAGRPFRFRLHARP